MCAIRDFERLYKQYSELSTNDLIGCHNVLSIVINTFSEHSDEDLELRLSTMKCVLEERNIAADGKTIYVLDSHIQKNIRPI